MSATLLSSNSTGELPPEFHIISTISQISGTFSLLVWLFAQLPQVFENYLNKSVSGVSAAFLFCWIGGDATNLIGCLLTRALSFQICLATYYCFIDVILSIQYWYYTRVYPHQTVHHNMLQSPNMMRPVVSNGPVKDIIQSRLNRFEASPHANRRNDHRSDSSSQRRIRKPRRSFLKSVLSASVISNTFKKVSGHPVNVDDDIDSTYATPDLRKTAKSILSGIAKNWKKLTYSAALVGTYSGWISTCLYVSSRIPQIVKNFRSKSTTGVSPFLFLFAMTGNILYTVSITSDLYLLSKYDSYLGDVDFHKVLSAQLPFLVGSSGTVMFDAILLFQFWLYKDSHPNKETHALLHGHNSMFHSPKETETANLEELHFTKPDWYTNNFQAVPSNSFSFEDHQGLKNDFLDTSRNRAHHQEHINHASLSRDPYIISPPHHYVTSSSQQSIEPSTSRGRGIAENFSIFARSFTNTPMRAPIRTSSISSPGVFGPNSSLPGTALLPSLVGTYSSISKKMANDAKVPFSPIDFLHDDFLNRSGSSGQR